MSVETQFLTMLQATTQQIADRHLEDEVSTVKARVQDFLDERSFDLHEEERYWIARKLLSERRDMDLDAGLSEQALDDLLQLADLIIPRDFIASTPGDNKAEAETFEAGFRAARTFIRKHWQT